MNSLGLLRISIWPFLFTSLLWLLRDKEWCAWSIKVQFSIHWSNFLNHYNLKYSRLQTIPRSLFNSQQVSTLNMMLANNYWAFQLWVWTNCGNGEESSKFFMSSTIKNASVSPIWCWCCSFRMQILFKRRPRHMRFLVNFFF